MDQVLYLERYLSVIFMWQYCKGKNIISRQTSFQALCNRTHYTQMISVGVSAWFSACLFFVFIVVDLALLTSFSRFYHLAHTM